jgi:hypothetical protein
LQGLSDWRSLASISDRGAHIRSSTRPKKSIEGSEVAVATFLVLHPLNGSPREGRGLSELITHGRRLRCGFQHFFRTSASMPQHPTTRNPLCCQLSQSSDRDRTTAPSHRSSSRRCSRTIGAYQPLRLFVTPRIFIHHCGLT